MVDLLKEYTHKAAATLGAAMDWDMVLAENPPTHLHIRNDGQPDRRYKNYLEAQQWLTEQSTKRTNYIEKRTNKKGR